MKEDMTTAEAHRRQLVAHDVLAELISVNGIDHVTDFLRYWLVVSALRDDRRGQRRVQVGKMARSLERQ